MSLRFLLLDFNSYFASVEQQLRPELRGRPVGVLPVLAETTCCIAASYEAKRCGVKTGTPVAEARRLCPDIVFVQARPQIYVEMHHRLMEVVDSVLAIGEVLSIDEVMCELTGTWQQETVAVALAHEVKQKLLDHVGECLTCSVGIAPNRFLAKVASNMQKPNGLTVIRPSDLPDVLFGLELEDLHGVGRAMSARLERARIATVQALCQASREALRLVWGGVEGERMYERLRGLEPALPPTRRASIGHSHVLPPHLRDDAGAWAVLSKLTQKAAVRLRAEGYLACRMSLAVEYRDRPAWAAGVRFAPMRATLDFLKVLAALWAGRPHARGLRTEDRRQATADAHASGQTDSPQSSAPCSPGESNCHRAAPRHLRAPSGGGREAAGGCDTRDRSSPPQKAFMGQGGQWAMNAHRHRHERWEPMKVSVTLWELVPADQSTLALFPETDRKAGLDAALDRLRLKYGPQAIYFGGAWGAMQEAPMRISFTHVPDLRLEADTAGDLALYEAT